MSNHDVPLNPFSDAAGDGADRALLDRIVQGDHDAEDATQEVLIEVITKLSTFQGRSAVRTWLYRIVVNHVLNMKRARGEAMEWTFEKYWSYVKGESDPSRLPV